MCAYARRVAMCPRQVIIAKVSLYLELSCSENLKRTSSEHIPCYRELRKIPLNGNCVKIDSHSLPIFHSLGQECRLVDS